MSKYSDYMFKETTKQFIKLENFIEPTPIQKKLFPWPAKEKILLVFRIQEQGNTCFFDSYYGKSR